jgi:hypothetical protein
VILAVPVDSQVVVNLTTQSDIFYQASITWLSFSPRPFSIEVKHGMEYLLFILEHINLLFSCCIDIPIAIANCCSHSIPIILTTSHYKHTTYPLDDS